MIVVPSFPVVLNIAVFCCIASAAFFFFHHIISPMITISNTTPPTIPPANGPALTLALFTVVDDVPKEYLLELV
jgi:hypothetical protein